MAPEHTPGPWRERQATGTVDRHIFGNGNLIAILPYKEGSPRTRNANARLITAAPETEAERDELREQNAKLLEALKELMAEQPQPCTDDDCGHAECEALDKGRAAVEEAEHGT